MQSTPIDDLDVLETQLTNMLLMPRPIRDATGSTLRVLRSQRVRIEALERKILDGKILEVKKQIAAAAA